MEPAIDFFDNKRIVITGGGGYLGSKLAERLVSSNVYIYLLDIKFNTISTALSEKNPNVQLISVDITQKEDIEEAILETNPDYVFHFAALLNRERNFSVYPALYDVNVKGTLNILEALRNILYKGFYFASSGEVYGTKNPVPFHEGEPPSPATPYSLSKLMAEQLIKNYSEINQKPFTILRIFNFYGAGMSESFFINQLIATLKSNKQFDMTGGDQVRDFIYIDDLLNAIIGISKSEQSLGEIINICSGKGVKLKEIATELAQQMGKMNLLKIGALPYRENEVWNMVGNTSKLSRFGVDLNNTDLHLNINKLIR